jgi:glycosyltransferase involved in cell wall biosynthesis
MRVPPVDVAVVAEREHSDHDYQIYQSIDSGISQDLLQRSNATAAVSAKLAERETRTSGLRVALVHEWLETLGGSERVLEQLLHCFPSADIFTVVDFMGEEDRRLLRGRAVRTTFIQRLPFARRHFRHYLGLMPLAIQQLDMSGYDLIISSNHAVAKGVLTGPDQVHISYVHSPMRYAWDLQHQYLRHAHFGRGLKGIYARWLLKRLREWDVSSAHHVDHFIANSNYIARRIAKSYRRDATVIHPPVDVDRFAICHQKDDFFLLAGRLVPYKRSEIVIEAFANNPTRRLIVVGDGPESQRAHRAARNVSNIEFRGSVSGSVLVDLMQRARALISASEEDFGITMVEAQACGTPVISYCRGGAADIVIPVEMDNPTGLFFYRQEAAAISEALERFEGIEARLSRDACRSNALRFSERRFRTKIMNYVENIIR